LRHNIVEYDPGPQLEREKFMASKEQLSILKQGVEVWNDWRAKNLYVYADFNEADLNGTDLRGVDLRLAHLRRANLVRADLRGADLSGADLSDADFWEANLSEANLTKTKLNGASLGNAFAREANLSQSNLLAANLRNTNLMHANISDANLMLANLGGADLSGANLSKTNLTKARLAGINLRRADLSRARLTRTNLTKSNLMEAEFIGTDLIETNIAEAKLGATVFANSDLSQTIGLESVDHRGPSHISMDTFILSKGRLPDVFLRGCGLSDADMEYAKLSNPELGMEELKKILYKIHALRTAQTMQISPLFVSYSQANSQFVDKIGGKLAERGIRYWRDIHELKAGQMEKPVDGAVRQNPTVLLVLSKDSLSSDWVEHEVRTAKGLEQETGRHILCPVALDDSWKDGRWPKRIMEQIAEYNILDFSGWKDRTHFEEMFRKLIETLELFHKG
jgi:uncharacterized protein YjbI with pentapeptide repeats